MARTCTKRATPTPVYGRNPPFSAPHPSVRDPCGTPSGGSEKGQFPDVTRAPARMGKQSSWATATRRLPRTNSEPVGPRAAHARFRRAERQRGGLLARRLDVVQGGRAGLDRRRACSYRNAGAAGCPFDAPHRACHRTGLTGHLAFAHPPVGASRALTRCPVGSAFGATARRERRSPGADRIRGRSRSGIRHDVIHRSVPNLNVRDASAGHDFYVDCR